jgi:GH24 family phage-related lysozyme (muramidase)
MNAGKWAMLGAAIGSVVPVVGTILGGVVGAILGGIMGYFGGDVIAEKIDAVFTDIGRFVEDSWDGLKDIGTYIGSQVTNLVSQLMASAKIAVGKLLLSAGEAAGILPGGEALRKKGSELISSGEKDSADATAKKDAELKAAKDASSKRDTNKATAREGEDAATVVRQANNEEKKKAAESTPGVGAMVADQVAAAKPAGAQGGSFPTDTSPQQAGAPVAGGGAIAGGDINSVSSTPSKSLLEMIKAKEGFRAKAFWDHKQWSIGYGTQAKDGSEVVTKEEAEKRLSADVEKRKAYVLTFGKKNGYSWGEQQVDALTSFIYNLGYGALDQVTGKGKRSNAEIAKAMLQYNKASGQVNAGLAKRRGEENALFSGGATGGGGSPQMAAAGGGSTATLPTSQVGAMNSTAQGGSFPTGAAVSSASSAVSDGRMDLASAPPVVNVTAPSPPSVSSKGSGGTGSASADVYDRDITKLLVGRAFSFS